MAMSIDAQIAALSVSDAAVQSQTILISVINAAKPQIQENTR